MYAIRSYYADIFTYAMAILGLFVFKWTEIRPHSWILFLFLGIFFLSYIVSRITSYNVCYTKLLRSLTGLLGITTLTGMVVRNGIILIDYAQKLRIEHPIMTIREVALAAGKRRMRPIFLTSAAASVVITSYSIHYTKLYELDHFHFLYKEPEFMILNRAGTIHGKDHIVYCLRVGRWHDQIRQVSSIGPAPGVVILGEPVHIVLEDHFPGKFGVNSLVQFNQDSSRDASPGIYLLGLYGGL